MHAVDEADVAMPSASSSGGVIGEAALSEHSETLWALYKAHPHLGTDAMAALVSTHIGEVNAAAVGEWLRGFRGRNHDLARLRFYVSVVKEFMDRSGEHSAEAIRRFLLADYNLRADRRAIGRLCDHILKPPGMRLVTLKVLREHDGFLEDLLDATPLASPLFILEHLQTAKDLTADLYSIRRWRQEVGCAEGCVRVCAKDIPADFWDRLLLHSLDISVEEVQDRLSSELRLSAGRQHLDEFLKRRWREEDKRVMIRESVRSHWEKAISKHFGVTSVSIYPARQLVSASAEPLWFWAECVSWAVCGRCGRRDTALWRTPTLTNMSWQLACPDMRNGLDCTSHALWQQRCAKEAWALCDVALPTKSLQSWDTYISPRKHHWPVYDEDNDRFVDGANFENPTVSEGRGSLLELSCEEAWSLSIVRVSMDLRQERGKQSKAKTDCLKKCSMSRIEWQRQTVWDALLTPKAKAAYRWLMVHNDAYAYWSFKG